MADANNCKSTTRSTSEGIEPGSLEQPGDGRDEIESGSNELGETRKVYESASVPSEERTFHVIDHGDVSPESDGHLDPPEKDIGYEWAHINLDADKPAEPGENSKVKQVSEGKREGNRGNAQLSTGPRRERGKKISRLNSLKHGLLARTIPLRNMPYWGEGEEKYFRRLLGDVSFELRPDGRLEEICVEEIVYSYLRLSRLHRFEGALIKIAMHKEHQNVNMELADVEGDMGGADEKRKQLNDLLDRGRRAVESDEMLPEELMRDINDCIVNPKIRELIGSYYGTVNYLIRRRGLYGHDSIAKIDLRGTKVVFLLTLMRGVEETWKSMKKSHGLLMN